MKLKLYFTILLFCTISLCYAQVRPTRVAFEINGGIPVMFASIAPAFSTFGGVGFRYSFTPSLSLQTSFNAGTLRGAQTVNTEQAQIESPASYTKSRNDFYQYTLRGQLNLKNMLKLQSVMPRINPFLVFGAGYTGTWGITAERFDGRSRSYNDIPDFWTIQAGALIRYHMNPMLDLNVGTDLNFTQTYFLDGIPMDHKRDMFMMNYVGVSVNIGAVASRQHIEWNYDYAEHKKSRKQKNDLAKNEPDHTAVPEESPVPAAPATPEPKPADAPLVVPSDPGKVKNNRQELAKNPTAPEVKKEPEAIQAASPDPAKITPSKVAAGDKNPVPVTEPKPADEPLVVTPEPGKVKPDRQELAPKPAASEVKKEPQAIHAASPVPAKTTPSEVATAGNTKTVNVQADPLVPELNQIEGVSKPVAVYNVIAGCFRSQKNAYAFRNRLRKLGFQSAIFKSSNHSKMLRVCICSTNNREFALEQLKKVKHDVEKDAWIHIYYK